MIHKTYKEYYHDEKLQLYFQQVRHTPSGEHPYGHAMPWQYEISRYVQGKDYLTSKQIIEYYWNIAKVCLTACLMSVAAP